MVLLDQYDLSSSPLALDADKVLRFAVYMTWMEPRCCHCNFIGVLVNFTDTHPRRAQRKKFFHSPESMLM